MKRIIFLLLTCAFIANAEYYPSRFDEGFTYSAIETRLFSFAADTSETVIVIPAGELLEIKEFTGETFMADSCSWGWYRARYRVENREYDGFVRDRNLAFAHLPLGLDTLFVFSLSGFNATDNAFEGAISIISDGQILFSEDYRPNWTPYGRMFDYDVTASAANPQNLTNVRKLIVFYSGLDVSGVQCREDLFLWTDDGRLVEGPQAISLSEDEDSRQTTVFILPSTPGGEADRISLRERIETFNRETQAWMLTSEQTSDFFWTGSRFEEH